MICIRAGVPTLKIKRVSDETYKNFGPSTGGMFKGTIYRKDSISRDTIKITLLPLVDLFPEEKLALKIIYPPNATGDTDVEEYDEVIVKSVTHHLPTKETIELHDYEFEAIFAPRKYKWTGEE